MHFTDIFVKRPVLATVVSLLILLAGLQAAFKLPIRQFPEVSDVKIEVTTAYPGANADQITNADATSDCYIVDDSTVAKTNGSGTRSVMRSISMSWPSLTA